MTIRPHLITIFLLLMLLPVMAMAQGARYDSFASTINTAGGVTNLMQVLPGAKITVCNFPGTGGTPCTNLATTYTDQTVSVPCGGSTQVVLQGTSSCVANGDSFGNFGFWVKPGSYTYCISATGATTQCYAIVVAGTSDPTSFFGTLSKWIGYSAEGIAALCANGSGQTAGAFGGVYTVVTSNAVPTAISSTEPAICAIQTNSVTHNEYFALGGSVTVNTGIMKEFRARVGNVTNLTNEIFFVGIGNPPYATNNPGNIVAFRCSTTVPDTNWQAMLNSTANDTGVACDHLMHTFRIVMSGSGTSATFFIDGVQVFQSSSNIPAASVGMQPFVSLSNNATTNVENIFVSYILASFNVQ